MGGGQGTGRPAGRRPPWAAIVWSTSLALLGCGAEDQRSPTTPGPEPEGCALPERPLDDGGCLTPGDGAGIEPDACGDGFVTDGDRGCEPILPSEPCNPGEIAYPGLEACAPLGDCDAGPYGAAVPTGAIHVDGAHAGASDGSSAAPFTTIGDAVAAAVRGDTIVIAEGTYSEAVVVEQRVTLRGRCPGLVTVSPGLGGVGLTVLAEDVVVSDLGLEGGTRGVDLLADGARLSRIWLRDSAEAAIYVAGSAELSEMLVEGGERGIVAAGVSLMGDRVNVRDTANFPISLVDDATATPSTVTLHRTLVDRGGRVGVFVQASNVTLADSVVRHTTSPGEDLGWGVLGQPDAELAAEASVEIQRSLISDNLEFGIRLSHCRDSRVEDTVVRDTRPALDPGFASGIKLDVDPGYEVAGSGVVERSLLVRNAEVGLSVVAATARVDRVLVRDSIPVQEGPTATTLGNGIVALHQAGLPTTSLDVTRSVVEGCSSAGLWSVGADVTVESTAVRSTQPEPETLLRGQGVHVTSGLGDAPRPGSMTVRWSVIADNHEVGAIAYGDATLTMEASVVSDTHATRGGFFGWGIAALSRDAGLTRPTMHLSNVQVLGSHEAGVVVAGANATVTAVSIDDTQTAESDLFGDGLVLAAFGGSNLVELSDSRIAGSARAGIAHFAGQLVLRDVALACNEIHFVVADGTDPNLPATLDNQGGVTCGCDGDEIVCKAQAAQLEPPSQL